jgi:flagellar hook-length control protein FliK
MPGGTPGTADSLPGVASQLVTMLSPLRALPGGGQVVTIGLHPQELGVVRATIVASADQVTVRLDAATDAGRQALRQALPELGQHLSSTGQRAVVVLADDRGGGRSGGQTTGGPPRDGGSGSPAGAPRHPGTPRQRETPGVATLDPIGVSTGRRTGAGGRLDLRL